MGGENVAVLKCGACGAAAERAKQQLAQAIEAKP